MALHTKKEFAALCGMTTAELSVHAGPKRRKVIYSGDMVDGSIEPNTSFLQKWSAKREPLPPPEPKKESLRMIRPPKNQDELDDRAQDEDDEPPPNEFAGLDAKKVATQIRKMEKEIEKLTLSNSKANGQVVPVHLMDSIFLQERQSILMESKNVLQDVLTIFAKRRDLTPYERSDISGEFTDRLNEMMTRAASVTEKAVENIVREFSIKRSVGERI